MREFELLRHVFEANTSLPTHVLVPPGDDMAMLHLSGHRLLATVDQVVDGRHVRVTSTPIELVGRKAITRSLSDVAAMAGAPVGALVAVTLPPDFGNDRAVALFDAMARTGAQYGCPLVGGDIALHSSASNPMVCSVTILAEPVGGRVITRSGAKPGDIVCVTGPLGGSLQPNGLGRHLTFEPRIDLALELAANYGDRLHAMIDISDGLGRDASHIAQMSNVQIVLDAQRVLCNPGCDWRRALSDGEDYELCFAVQPPLINRVLSMAMIEVGVVRQRARSTDSWVVVRDGANEYAADELGWQHES
jgi:thiamine-monophosphate kinase